MEDSYQLYLKARNHFDLGEIEEAIKYFIKSNEVNPHFKTLELLGEAYIKLGKYNLAITPLAAATALNNNVKAPSKLAEAFYHLSMHDEAQHFANIALERDPNNKLSRTIIENIKNT